MTEPATHPVETRIEARIFYDPEPDNPRTYWDNLTTMVYGHRNYTVGDRKPDEDEDAILNDGGWTALLDTYLLRGASHGNGQVLWARKYGMIDHSGIAIYLGGGNSPFDPGGWDSGTVGIIFVTEERRNEMSVDLADVERIALAEFDEYCNYIHGNVYGYCITEYTKCEACGAEKAEMLDSYYDIIGDPDPETYHMIDMVEDKYKQILIDAYKKDGVHAAR